MPGALSGLVIADFSRVLAGPYATMLLGDLEAEVIKVERPGRGDDTRSWGPPYNQQGESTYFAGLNRNKTSLFLDLSKPDDIAAARVLIGRADVLVENFTPGTMDRVGLDYDSAVALNSRLVYCSITGFGSAGGASLPGYDLLVQAMGGLMSITGPNSDEPTKAGVAFVDVVTGLHAVYGILAALRHRDLTGLGQHVEVNLLSSLLSAMVNQSAAYAGAKVIPHSMGNDHPSISPYSVYATADQPMVLAVGNDGQFAKLAIGVGAPEWIDDPRFETNPARVEHREELRREIESRLKTRNAAEWVDQLREIGVPCGPINDMAQAFALATELGLQPITAADQVANPVQFSATPPSYRLPPPRLHR